MPTKLKLFTKSIVAFGLVLVLVGLVFGFKFMVDQKASAVGEISQSLALATHKRDNLSELQSKVVGLDSQIVKVDNFVISEDDLVLFIESLEKIGQTVGVEVLVDSVQEVEGVTFLVKASGSFDSLYRLISLVDVMPYPVLIEDLKLESLPDTVGLTKNIWQADINLRLLVEPIKSSK
jgi:hypothetical protein